MRSKNHELLIEIGCEELPAKNLLRIQKAFSEALNNTLNTAQFSFKNIQCYATPRRLAAQITELSTETGTQTVTKKGPSQKAAFDEKGKPTKAAIGFARSCGVSVDNLKVEETDKGAWLIFEEKQADRPIEEVLPGLIEKILSDLPVGKRMSLNNTTSTFSRPIHWIILLLDKAVIDATLFGIKTGQLTHGHRFHYPKTLSIDSPKDYEQTLEKTGFVIPNFEKRRETILTTIQTLAKKNSCEAIIPEDLLNEVTGLVEYPVVLLGRFNPEFLNIPAEVLTTSMQTHQKYFTTVDQNQKILPTFFIVSNIQSNDPNTVIKGNECVLDARLADAAFYYRADKEIPFQKRREGLKQVRFQAELGTLWDKSVRIASLSKIIAEKTGANSKQTEQAALLCKNDLLTQMVGEFPELQGVMGRHYALCDKESETVALAIEEQYYPRFSKDRLPDSPEGSALALADRIDTLVGLFGTGNRPTGVKDPFSLRRQALGLLRILIEKEIPLDLKLALNTAKNLYQPLFSQSDVVEQVMDFCFERLRAWYQEQEIPMRTFEAVLAQKSTCPFDFHKRILAINAFVHYKEANALAAANKRVKNILSKNSSQLPTDLELSPNALKEDAEKELAECLSSKKKEVEMLLKNNEYETALKALSSLEKPIDRFFSEVMIMTDDLNLRKNRFKLLYQLRALFLQIADISLL